MCADDYSRDLLVDYRWIAGQPVFERFLTTFPSFSPAKFVQGRNERETFDLTELKSGQDATPGAFLAVDQKSLQSSGISATASVQPATELLADNGITARSATSSSARPSTSSDVAGLMNTTANASRNSCVNMDHVVTTTQTLYRQLSVSQRSSSANLAITKGRSGSSRVVKHKDGVVNLIAMFLTRTQQDSSSEKGAGKDLQTNALPEVDSSEKHTRLGRQTPNSEVVIRTQADTTESLVQRCGTLGLIEGHLCRARICSGLWGKDAACPAGSTAPVH